MVIVNDAFQKGKVVDGKLVGAETASSIVATQGVEAVTNITGYLDNVADLAVSPSGIATNRIRIVDPDLDIDAVPLSVYKGAWDTFVGLCATFNQLNVNLASNLTTGDTTVTIAGDYSGILSDGDIIRIEQDSPHSYIFRVILGPVTYDGSNSTINIDKYFESYTYPAGSTQVRTSTFVTNKYNRVELSIEYSAPLGDASSIRLIPGIDVQGNGNKISIRHRTSAYTLEGKGGINTIRNAEIVYMAYTEDYAVTNFINCTANLVTPGTTTPTKIVGGKANIQQFWHNSIIKNGDFDTDNTNGILYLYNTQVQGGTFCEVRAFNCFIQPKTIDYASSTPSYLPIKFAREFTGYGGVLDGRHSTTSTGKAILFTQASGVQDITWVNVAVYLGNYIMDAQANETKLWIRGCTIRTKNTGREDNASFPNASVAVFNNSMIECAGVTSKDVLTTLAHAAALDAGNYDPKIGVNTNQMYFSQAFKLTDVLKSLDAALGKLRIVQKEGYFSEDVDPDTSEASSSLSISLLNDFNGYPIKSGANYILRVAVTFHKSGDNTKYYSAVYTITGSTGSSGHLYMAEPYAKVVLHEYSEDCGVESNGYNMSAEFEASILASDYRLIFNMHNTSCGTAGGKTFTDTVYVVMRYEFIGSY